MSTGTKETRVEENYVAHAHESHRILFPSKGLDPIYLLDYLLEGKYRCPNCA